MRTRFLIIIFIVLAITVSAVSFVHLYFFKAEKLQLVDQQIEQTAAVLVSSDFAYTRIEDREEGDDIIVELLGQAAINLVVVLRDLDGNVLFENENAELLRPSLLIDQPWQSIELEKFAVRVLTLRLPKRQKILQVGLVLNQNLIRWKLINQRVVLYIALILAGVMLISIFLRSILLRPLNDLTGRLEHMAVDIESGRIDLDTTLNGKTKLSPSDPKDEFSRLTHAVQQLAGRIHENFKTTRLWTAQMVHEIKTPMTIIRNHLESDQGRADRSDAIGELDRLAEMVDEFLGWSTTESQLNLNDELHAIRIEPFARSLCQSLESIFPGRIIFQGKSDVSVFCKPNHLTQALSNLIVNAAKYSEKPSQVIISLNDHEIQIRDHGPGIPPNVIHNLGRPFNRGNLNDLQGRKGTGLGLAWVSTICRKYSWNFSIDSSQTGAIMKIHFPEI